MINPHAVYVHCDGAMDYSSQNPGGVGFLITFPDSVNLEPIPITIGTYIGGNIERLELEALIQAMKKTIEVFKINNDALKNIRQIIFITDRYGLIEEEKTSAYRIREWRRNKWKNHEGKPIKNHKLLDELDKTRKKLSDKTFCGETETVPNQGETVTAAIAIKKYNERILNQLENVKVCFI